MHGSRSPFLVLTIGLAVAGCAMEAESTPPADDGQLANEDALAPSLSTTAMPSWRFPAPNWSPTNKEAGRVDDLRAVGSTIYIGGNFTESADHAGHTATRTYLAAIDSNTGALLPFAPQINARVRGLAVSADKATLYAGGDFSTVSGKAHGRIVAFDVASGAVTHDLDGISFNDEVRAIAPSGSSLFVGGAFTTVNGQPRARLARLDWSASASKFVLSSWAPKADDKVYDIVIDSATNRVLAAGWFKSINGQAAQKHLVALDPTSGAPLPWANHPTAEIFDLAISQGTVYAAMGGPGGTALAYDLATGKQRFYYKTDGNVQAVTVIGGYPVFGMHGDFVAPKPNTPMSEFGSSARVARHKVFILDPNGNLQPWDPLLTTTQGVLGAWALWSAGGQLFVGGDFTKVHGVVQERFAIFGP